MAHGVGPSGEHSWVGGRCARCDLGRREIWVLDDEDRPVLGLLWSNPQDLPVRAIAFPWMIGLEPAQTPLTRLAEAYPDLPTGSEPPCLAH